MGRELRERKYKCPECGKTVAFVDCSRNQDPDNTDGFWECADCQMGEFREIDGELYTVRYKSMEEIEDARSME